MKSITIALAALAAASGVFADTTSGSSASTTSKGVEEPSAMPTLGAQIVQGCFSSYGELVFNSKQEYNSKSKCAHDICYAAGKLVAGTTGGNQCYCGDKYPPKISLANDSDCNAPCTGYDPQACGGIGFFTIYNTGVDLEVDYSDDSVASSSVSSSTAAASTSAVSTVSGSVIYVTQTAEPTESTAPKKHSSSNAGVIAGVVVAVVAVAGIVGGVFFFMRRKRNREIEEEHRRNAAVNAFIHGAKPPSSSGGISLTDSRLDPVMAQRRMSDGSIADNQDYSRRILRVTNA
ncbi:Cell wall integrity and stress response component 1 [Pleurostoma richardsiae]|uniref:Cell wall integrity and stress response component 1 n=1 Tax=Pleurostoma richardsiae TaxID=41990 RepID=A0AA38RHD5_9PEZI|nr:Cell wall integrity and stress response component 1 [Pleurostoma richardsiae]